MIQAGLRSAVGSTLTADLGVACLKPSLAIQCEDLSIDNLCSHSAIHSAIQERQLSVTSGSTCASYWSTA